ncbi:DUF998 domain-containing protein [Streptosporangium sp. NPDC050855]|uniref:DUF998 domain-containing protein n=1 Tax=Streptosporangium sp. NPDC050855 TaxID=3366194 RepID=UPI003793D906
MTLTPPSPPQDDRRTAAPAERSFPARAAGVSSIAGIAFLLLLALLHLIRPDVSTSWQTTSEYALGDLGWLMTVAFLLSATGYGALAIALLARPRRLPARIGAVVLAVVAAGTVVGGVFVTDPLGTPQDRLSTTGTLHGLGAGLALMFLPVAALLIAFGLARDGSFSTVRRALWWSAALPFAALVMFMVAQAVLLGAGDGGFGPDVPIGWPERILVLAYAAWQIIVARIVSRRTGW